MLSSAEKWSPIADVLVQDSFWQHFTNTCGYRYMLHNLLELDLKRLEL